MAISNALPALQAKAAYVTKGDHGDGVAELIGHMLAAVEVKR